MWSRLASIHGFGKSGSNVETTKLTLKNNNHRLFKVSKGDNCCVTNARIRLILARNRWIISRVRVIVVPYYLVEYRLSLDQKETENYIVS